LKRITRFILFAITGVLLTAIPAGAKADSTEFKLDKIEILPAFRSINPNIFSYWVAQRLNFPNDARMLEISDKVLVYYFG